MLVVVVQLLLLPRQQMHERVQQLLPGRWFGGPRWLLLLCWQ
jgi:hypothetical protein